jgi:hypothetical protein
MIDIEKRSAGYIDIGQPSIAFRPASVIRKRATFVTFRPDRPLFSAVPVASPARTSPANIGRGNAKHGGKARIPPAITARGTASD